MNIKIGISILIAIPLLHSTSFAKNNQKDFKKDFHGNVKIITTTSFEAISNFDKNTKGKDLGTTIDIYDIRGNHLESQSLELNKKISTIKYEYVNNSTRLLKFTNFDERGSITNMGIYKYPKKNYQEFMYLNPNGSQILIQMNNLDDRDNVLIKKVYSNGLLTSNVLSDYNLKNRILSTKESDKYSGKETFYKYENDYLIEMLNVISFSDGKIISKFTYSYNSNGNLINKKIFEDNDMSFNSDIEYTKFDLQKNWLEKIEIPRLMDKHWGGFKKIVQRKIEYF